MESENQMESENLQGHISERKARKDHTFGPNASIGQIEAKELDEEFKKNLTVSFKQQDDVIIVENWKNYNVDVSNPNFQIQSKNKQNTGCWNICITF